MFKKLKECKTLKEIYQVLGNRPFEIISVFLLLIWVFMPIISTISQILITLGGNYDVFKTSVVMADYRHNIQSLGFLTLEFVVIYILGRVILNKGQILKKIKSEPWHYFLLAMLLWSCISTALSDDPHTSFFGSDYRFDGLMTYFFYASVYVCALVVINGKYRKRLLTLFTLLGNVVSGLVILQDFGIGFWEEVFIYERATMFFHFNHTGYYLNLVIVCSIGMYLFSESRLHRVYYLFSMILQIYAILVNSTFASFLASWCALIMLLIFYIRHYRKCSLKMFVPVLVIVVLCIASYCGYVPTSSGEDMRYNMRTLLGDMVDISTNAESLHVVQDRVGPGHGRFGLWRQGLKMIPKRPLFGYGPEMLDEELSKVMWVNRPDNEFIQHAIFMGIPGLVFYLLALFSMFISQWKNMKTLDITTIVAAGCVIAYLISSLFGNSMFYTTPYLYMFLGLASLYQKEDKKI